MDAILIAILTGALGFFLIMGFIILHRIWVLVEREETILERPDQGDDCRCPGITAADVKQALQQLEEREVKYL